MGHFLNLCRVAKTPRCSNFEDVNNCCFLITHVHLVTPCVSKIAASSILVREHNMRCLRSVNTAATSLPEKLALKLKHLLQLEDLRQGNQICQLILLRFHRLGYGQTEVQLISLPPYGTFSLETVGPPLLGNKIKVCLVCILKISDQT